MKRKLELRDIAGYIPYGLHAKTTNNEFIRIRGSHEMIFPSIPDDFVLHGKSDYSLVYSLKPILRPLSDLYKTIKHNGKEVVPILELAKIAYIDDEGIDLCNFILQKRDNNGQIYVSLKKDRFEFFYNDEWNMFYSYLNGEIYDVPNQYQLFDYLHELKIDYRGLIDDGLAVSVYDFENEIYN